jgi:hypothetical protein
MAITSPLGSLKEGTVKSAKGPQLIIWNESGDVSPDIVGQIQHWHFNVLSVVNLLNGLACKLFVFES